ncbi:ATP-binding protein [Bacillus sp. 1P06AnD]|uniref:hybrid sensor histidine kinase/response regulator n=1 Tax=Bacillus sp. 1P06AnD TaxID=3132208 RepID=UPI00399F0568
MAKKSFALGCSVFIFFIVLIMIAYHSSDQKISVAVVNGQIDLRNVDLDDKTIVSLDGKWDFIPGPLFPMGKSTPFPKSGQYQKVPGPWNQHSATGTYHLRILLPEKLKDYGFRIRNIWSSHTLYINGEKAGEMGSPITHEQKNIPYEVFGESQQKVLDLVIIVGNYSNVDGGIIRSIDFGSERAISQSSSHSYMLEWSSIIILLIFSLYHFSLFIVQTQENMYLYSAVYFFSLAMMISTRLERVITTIVPSIDYETLFKLQDFLTYSSGIILIYLLMAFEPKLLSKKKALVLVSPILQYVLSILAMPARMTSVLQEEVMVYTYIICLILIGRLLWMAKHQQSSMMKNEAWIFVTVFICLLLFALGGVLDAIRIPGIIIISHVGLVGFAIMMNVFMAIRLRNRSEESIRLEKQLEASTEVKDEFLAVASHELQSPLHGISNLLETFIHQNKRNLSSQQLEKLSFLEKMTERLMYHINDLQDFTKLKFNDLEITQSSVDLRVAVSIVSELLKDDFEYKNISFRNLIVDGFFVWADEEKLRQVLFNVLMNAIQYTVEGTITIAAEEKDGRIYMYISDSGVGITSEDQQSIFQYLFTSGSGGGIGLGLYLSKKFMNHMDGQIWLHESQIGKGTTIGMYLPIAERIDGDTESTKAKEWKRERKTNNSTDAVKGKMIIVNDQLPDGSLLQTLVEEEFDTIHLFSGLQAMQYLEEHHVDYMVIDVFMPGMSGFDLTREIRKNYSMLELPIILTTVVDSPRYIKMAYQAGANDYLSKPYTKETINNRLQAIRQIKETIQTSVEHEMAFLQAQINPHFLYNAISSIISFCYSDGERAAYLLSELSFYLRYVLQAEKDRASLTLLQEIEVIKAYVSIEKARYGDRFSFSVNISPTINPGKIHIPSLLIQPLVENAIRHGISNKEEELNVVLSVQEHAGETMVIVKDNGIGMSKVQINHLLSEEAVREGIGLTNVNRRVRQLENVQMHIHSEEGIGTEVAIEIKKRRDHHVEDYHCRG